LQYFIHHFIQSSSSSYTTRRVPLPEREEFRCIGSLATNATKAKSKEKKAIEGFQVLSKPDPS